ncbi:MAG: L-aspartate oxidase [Flavobacteriia bacterium]|nr:L-aspartate oxidase [Flavobacteriia bacterium]
MYSFDVCIIGTGIAGLTTAIKLSEQNPSLQIACFSKERKKETNTRLAQGGIACVIDKEDDFELHIQDTLKAGKYKNNTEVVQLVVQNSPNCINTLIEWGVPFNRNKSGQLALGLEGGHSKNRIVHVNDYTGKAIQDVLIKKSQLYPNIHFFTNQIVFEIISINQQVVGFYSFDNQKQEISTFKSSFVVLATGGMGHFFNKSTNSVYATGDGIILAHQVGADIKNLNSIQFHPTALYEKRKKKLFLISEAVRGYGAHIVNKKGERFLFQYDERGELATRDIISKAIYQEMKKNNEKCVYMDLKHLQHFSEEFPMIAQELIDKGFSIKEDLIPIVPAAHYQCGGINVNTNAQTNIKNLYAVGECSETGLHGLNRLASNSLLEAFVYAGQCSKHILSEINDNNHKPLEFSFKKYTIENKISKIHQKILLLHKEYLKSFGLNEIPDDLKNKIINLIQEINKTFKKNKFSLSFHNDKNILELILLLENQTYRF